MGNIPEDWDLRHQRCENRMWCGHTSYSYKRCWDPGKGWKMGEQASSQEEWQVDISHNGRDAAQGLPSSSCCCPNSTTWNTRKQLGRRHFPTQITNVQQRVSKYSSYLGQNTWGNRSAAARSKVQFIFGTEHLRRLICTPGSYLVGTEFESRIGYESEWLSFLLFLIPSRQFLDSCYLNLGHDHFIAHSFECIIN